MTRIDRDRDTNLVVETNGRPLTCSAVFAVVWAPLVRLDQPRLVGEDDELRPVVRIELDHRL